MRKLKNEELDRLSVEEYKEVIKTPLVIVLDNVRSLNNVGAIFRTADCFLVEEIVLCGITAQPPHRDIRKTALGATESVDWRYIEDTLEAVKKLQKEGYTVCAIEQAEEADFLKSFQPAPGTKLAVIMGNEVKGVRQDVVDACDKTIMIEQYGTKHSLNIAVCTGVVIFDLYHKLNP